MIKLLFIFLTTISFVSSVELPKYRMIDLGLFGIDESCAISINEKGQILGRCEEGGCSFVFIWDKFNGLKLIDLPEGCEYWGFKFNNKGQIAGIVRSDSIFRVFLWDPNLGLWEVETSKNNIYLAALNDQGQILFNVDEQMIFFDHGKKTNLTTLFKKQVPGQWNSCFPVALNNYGHVAFNTSISNSNQHHLGCRSFLWKDDSFKTVVSENEWKTLVNIKCVDNDVNVVCMDDEGNMILTLYSYLGGGSFAHLQYFISPSRNVNFSCQGCYCIRNGLPIAIDCLHGKLKKDNQDKLYISKGLQIKKLLKDEYPYYNVSSADVSDQNSKGYVVGQIDTMFPGRHAFLAIPEE